MASKDVKLAIKIAGEIDKSLGSSVQMTKRQLRSIAVDAALADMRMAKYQAGFQSWGDGVSRMNAVAGRVAGVAVAGLTAAAGATAAVGTASIQAGSEFESAFAGIKKTVDATQPELDQLEDSIRQMAKEKPQTAVELAGIGESAGQLGIATENIEGFVDTVSDLTVATNLMADQGDSDMARFANITKMPQDQFGRLGSTLVALGNTSATTEAEIMEMGMRIAAAGTQVGMSQDQILGMSAALSSVGMEAEAGGSAVSKALINMQLAVEQGSDALSDYASVAGMTREEFSKLFREDAGHAFTAFVSGLNDTERNGKSAIAILDEMGLSEVRLRDSLLRAANASDLFNKSFKTANTAWKENTALAKEAEQYYATFERRMEMVQNRLNDTGISIYQNFRPALNDILGLALDVTDTGIFNDDFIADMAESVEKNIPTVVREVKQAGNAFKDFADPLIGEAAENLPLIESGIVGVGTAIVSANAIKLVGNLATSFSALKAAALGNPLGMALTVASAGITALAAVNTYFKKTAEEAKEANLAEHFGNINLSLDELGRTAEYIIDDGSLSKLNTVMEEMGKVKDLSRSLKDTTGELNKLNWKIGIGLELTDTERADYGNAIEKYISDSLEMVQQRQYASSLNLDMLIGDDAAGQQLKEKINGFYGNINGQISDLGRQLGEVYSDALTDGMIDVDEAKAIQGIQKQMADITASLADSEFEAGLQTLGIKYGGGNLSADAFKNLQAELGEQLEAATQDAQKALSYSLQDLDNALKARNISQAEYDKNLAALRGGYRDQIAGYQTRAMAFQVQTITDQYEEEFNKALPNIQKALTGGFDKMMQSLDSQTAAGATMDEAIEHYLGIDQLDQSTIDAVSDLWTLLEPQFDQLQNLAQQYIDAGETVPESILMGLTDAAAIGAIAGNQDAIWQMMASNATSSGEYAALIAAMQAAGFEVPEQLSAAISANKTAVNSGINDAYAYTKNKVNQTFSNPLSVTIPIRVKLWGQIVESNMDQIEKNAESYGSDGRKTWIYSGIEGHATGGLFTSPHIGMVAEAGPEAIIPLNNSRRSRDLWKKAGEAIGGSSETVTIQFAPVYNLSGGVSREEVRRVSTESFEEFKRNMERWAKDNRRLRF